jgi:hypothetical protein
MATPYEVPIEAFFRRIETDRDFFNYLSLSDADAIDLAKRRAVGYLREACAKIVMEAPYKSDFSNYDDGAETFRFDLTKKEVFLVASLMFEMYMSRDIAKLKCLTRDYVSTDLRVFDPSNARKTFKDLYDGVCAQNEDLLETYNCSDSSGKLRLIDFAAYDIDSED